MSVNTKFLHLNIIAHDWKRLAAFYEKIFQCTPVPPERDLSGEWVEHLTGVSGAEIRGVHLRLPGYGNEGPTLEILQYNHLIEGPPPAINRPGLAHIAIEVNNMKDARNSVQIAGGRVIGKVVTRDIPGVGKITLSYVTDPEGNIIELLERS